MFKSILVPLDGSEYSRLALNVACKLVSPEGGQIVLLHIPEPLPNEPLLIWGLIAVPMGATQEQRDQAGQKLLDRAIDAARAEGVETITPMLVHGDPRLVILSAAKEKGVEAIVMGSRGLSDIKGLMVGSIAHKVSHSAECHVITVH
ncbi:universal stress protein [Halomonas binhaiensis]|uniref:Universal stress protein n=1 Tax=Halomonas binhaiensis TaxID=2562282 RepID=A0A5C1NJC8_9GAMM|nr:universal stress protein [Halomonas binhaiensis]QEM82743.1 universal stress protein [Halomonas binhaiensis]